MMNDIVIRYVCLLILSLLLQTWNYLIRLSQELQLASVLPRRFTDVGELINKYTPLKSWAELDNLKWDNAPKGNVYTVSWLPDYDSEQHPANVGCVEVVRMGGGVTAQILYADNLKMYIRTILGTEEARWTAWTQV
mgnify:CR=1 FL=1